MKNALKDALSYKTEHGYTELARGGTLAIVHSCSDYDGYGEDSAMRDHVHEGWITRLDAMRADYAVWHGGHNTRIIVVRVKDSRSRKLASYSRVEDCLKQLVDYPIWDDAEYSALQWDYTLANSEWEIKRLLADDMPEELPSAILHTLDCWVDNDTRNAFYDYDLSVQYLHSKRVEEALKALGYRCNDVLLYENTDELQKQVFVAVAALTRVAHPMYVRGVIAGTVGKTDSTDIAQIAYAVVESLSD